MLFFSLQTSDPTGAENILRECGLGPDNLIYEDHSGGLLGRQMLRLVDSFSQPGANNYTLLGQLYLSFSYMVQKQPDRQSVVQGYVNHAMDFIHSNFSYEIGVAEVSRAVGVDRTFQSHERNIGRLFHELLQRKQGL